MALRNSKQQTKKRAGRQARSMVANEEKSLSFFSLKRQFCQLRLLLAVCLLVGLAGLGLVVLIHYYTGLPVSALTRDMASVCRKKAYIGILSTIGIILWSSASAISFFCFFILFRNIPGRRFAWFLFWSGLLTLQLVLDDALLFHERFFPDVLHLRQLWIYCGYAVATLAYIGCFFREILLTDYLLLGISGVLLASSMAADQWLQFSNMETFVEDALKFFGIIFWLVYFSRVGWQQVESIFKRQKRD